MGGKVTGGLVGWASKTVALAPGVIFGVGMLFVRIWSRGGYIHQEAGVWRVSSGLGVRAAPCHAECFFLQ